MRFENANDAFLYYTNDIMKNGIPFRDTKAIFNETFTIAEPWDNKIIAPIRKWSQSYADREWEWYMSGDRSIAEISKHAPLWKEMQDQWGNVWSNYGWWWKTGGQLEGMINLLKSDVHTRKAILSHYNPMMYEVSYEKDKPCNLILNFYVIEGFLYLTIFARSIDLWFGFCNDQYQFSKLMELVGKEISKPIGEMTYMITNFHLYNKQVDYVRINTESHR